MKSTKRPPRSELRCGAVTFHPAFLTANWRRVRPGLEPDVRVELAKLTVESAEGLDHAAVYDRDGGLIDVIREQEAEVLVPGRSWTGREAIRDAASSYFASGLQTRVRVDRVSGTGPWIDEQPAVSVEP